MAIVSHIRGSGEWARVRSSTESFYRMPKAPVLLPDSAVRLCSSITGFTSTISKLNMPAVVGDDFHGQVSFTIGCTATNRRAYAGRIFGIDPIHVE